MVARLTLSTLLLFQISFLLTAQNVGINTTIPTAPLHVVRNVSSSGPKLNHVMAILESDEESFIQLSNPENIATGILSGDRLTPIRSGILFNGDSSILFKTGGDISRMFLSNKGRVGINTLSPLAQLHIQDSSVLFTGPFPPPPAPSSPPISGPGTRMMWYSDKAAFRAGTVNSSNWDANNVGVYTTGLGFDVKADGIASTAIGAYATASGLSSMALGNSCQATGDFSTAFTWTKAKPYASFVVGAFNDTTCLSPTAWNPNDPLFIIGNGSSYDVRNNAMTVLKNGRTGINTPNPQSMFHVVRNGTSGGPYPANIMATFESNTTSFIHLTHPNNAYTGILSGNQETAIRSGILFDIDSALVFRSGGNFTKMKLSKQGYLGINTFLPKTLLHIVRSGASGGPLHANALATLESIGTGYIQFSQNNNAEAGILSGNANTEIRSGLVFGVDSSLYLRSGGNFNRLAINKDGDIGIGTISPKAKLHVKDGSSGVSSYSDAAAAIFESTANTFIQLASPASQSTGIIASDPVSSTRGGIYFTNLSTIDFNTAGNGTPRMRIDATGKVGIGTTTPEALMEVNGTFLLGSNGSSLDKVLQFSTLIDLPSIPAGGSYTASFSHALITASGTAHVSPINGLADGLIIAYARNTLNAVLVTFTNVTSSSINPPFETFFSTVIQ